MKQSDSKNLSNIAAVSGRWLFSVNIYAWLLTLIIALIPTALAQPSSPPVISAIADQGVFPGGTNRLISFTVSDGETPAQHLSVTGYSANPALIPNSGLVFGGSFGSRTLSIVPTSATGATTVTVVATDTQGGSSSNTFVVDVNWLTALASGIPHLGEARFVWGDYDNDGLPDLLTSGYDGALGNYVTRIYRNLGGNTFTDTNAGLTNSYRPALSWVDYNRDGLLDAFIGDGTTQLYRNTGSGFEPVNTGLPNMNLPHAAWGDFDNDGDPDLALLGTSSDGLYPLLYRNNGDDTFTGLTNAIPSLFLQYGSADWGDFDNDSDLDLVLSGREVSFLTKVFRNDGNAKFTEVASLAGVYNSTVRWGDFDNDGRLDILLSGGIGDFERVSRVYRNNGNQTFSDIGAGLTPATLSSGDWGDFDNDGDLDVALAGLASNSVTFARIYLNNANQTFTQLPFTLPSSYLGRLAWADTDHDGDLDLLVYGTSTIQLYRNNAPSNAPPLAPSGLSITTSTNGVVTFHWNPASDARTPAAGLGYNLRIGTNSGGISIVSPQANVTTGLRRVAQQALTHTNRWKITDLPKGTYYWSVQAMDTTLAGSPFAAEQTFTITNTPPAIIVAPEVRTGPSALVTLPFSVTDNESAAAQIVVTAQSANSVFIPPASIMLTGTGTSRTVSFRIGPGQLGTNDLILQARDPQGYFREARVRVISEFFTPIVLSGATNFYELTPFRIGYGYPYASPVVDLDRDGDLDVLFQGTTYSNNFAVHHVVVASNDGSGGFSFNVLFDYSLISGSYSYQFDDFNRDNIVDLLAPGDSYSANGVQFIPGNGAGSFAAGQRLGPTFASMFADLDNDGDMDGLALSDNPVKLVQLENAAGQLRARPGPPLMTFTTYQDTATARASDLDNDGDVDFFIAGEGPNLNQRLVIRTLRNSGSGRFTAEEFPILGQASTYGTSVYDGDDDRDLDLVFSYQTNYSGPMVRAMAANNDGAFSFSSNITVPDLHGFDFDNDGDLDRWVSELISSSPFKVAYRLNLNTGPGQYAPQSSVISALGLAGDFDGDGDLDYFVATEELQSGIVISPRQWKLLRNNTDRTNAPPATPSGLTATQRTDDRITFSWNAAVDDHTPTNWMSYNLRIGTTPGGTEIISPCANLQTGRRFLSGEGNVGGLTFRDVRGLPSGTYYYSVQAVDGVFAASGWAPEQSITIVRPSISPLPDVVTPPGIPSKPIAFSVTGGSSPASALTITVVADDPTLIPQSGLVVTGTGANRSLTITPTNRSGDTDLTITATDLAGFSAIARCHVRVGWWDAQPQTQIGIQRFEEWKWADVDLDGWIDLFGYAPVGNSEGRKLSTFRNVGGGVFQSASNNLPEWTSYPVFVAGTPGDNVPDVLTLDRPDSVTSIFRVWQGTGANFDFIPSNEVSNRSMVMNHQWLDLDNDGFRDVVHWGWVTYAPTNPAPGGLIIARGRPGGALEYLPQRIPMYWLYAMAAADFDLDGDFDLVVSGRDFAANGQGMGTNFTRLYFNAGSGNFTGISAGLPQSIEWKLSVTDFDRDGWPDLLLNPASATVTNRPQLMRNVGGSFVTVASDLPTALNLATWGDFDNDGDADLLAVTSEGLSTLDFNAATTALFRNDGGALTRADVGLPVIAAHQGDFADVDNDGDLDLLISGETGWNMTGRFLCFNSSTYSNTPPPAPTGHSIIQSTAGVLFQWTPAPDAESGTALTYNLRIGTTPGGSEVLSAVANPVSGQRRLTGNGNIGHAPRWRLNPPDGHYYWSVQAVDAGYAASPFSAETSFTYFHPTIVGPTNVAVYAAAPPAVIPLVIGDVDSDAATLALTAFSSNTNVVSPADIVFGGSGSNRTATITLLPGAVGTSVVSVVVTDLTGLTATNTFSFSSSYFTDVTPVFSGSNLFNARWADYDNDNDLDLYLGGTIYRQDSGVFTAAGVVALGERKGVGWSDYDRDGDLDLAVIGNGASRIYRNEGNGTFTQLNAGLQGVYWSSSAWGDFNNDGRPDLLVSGALNSNADNPFTALYRNDGNGTFTPVAGSGLPVVRNSSVLWADFDRDGRMDVLMNGLGTGPLTWFADIYRNNGDGTFTGVNAGFIGGADGAVDAGDFDNDGDLDVLVTGFNLGTYVLHVYRNNGGSSFTEVSTLQGGQYGDVTWVDYDNDGWLDILVTGCTANYCDTSTTRIYRNNRDGTFSDINAGLPYIAGHPAAWGDFDKDGDLDLFLAGLHRNDVQTSNTPPTAPVALTADLLPDNNVRLRWNGALDAQNTNAAGLSYAVRIGTAPGLGDVVSPHADSADGFRRLPSRGPAATNAFFLRDLPKGTFFWSVQALDAGWAGSPFSAEASFAITNARPLISGIADQVTTPNRPAGPFNFTVSDAETAPAGLVLNGYSTNPALVPNANIMFGGSSSSRTVTVTPTNGLSGITTISIAVTDAGGITSTSRFTLTVESFVEVSSGLPTVQAGTGVATVWGDYDNDGDLDIGMAGTSYTTVYRNTNGSFTNQNFTLPTTYYYLTPQDLAWLDLDNDGDLDLTQSGWQSSGYTPMTYRFRNNFPTNTFANLGGHLPGAATNVADGAMAWGDYDNDGDLDLLLSGDTNTYHTPDAFTALYRNSNGLFINSGIVFPVLVRGAAAWGDQDNDGDLDLLLSGQTGAAATSSLTLLFRNDGDGKFTQLNTQFPGLTDCAVAFGDIDNDGDLDVAMTGTANNSAPLARIYRNLGGGTFTNLNVNLLGITYGALSWGDFNNDGYADLAICGSTNANVYDTAGIATRVYLNKAGTTFTNVGGTLPGAMRQNVSWGDYDRDGDLDLLVGTRLARNNWNGSNTPPSAPVNLSATPASNNAVLLTWSAASDLETTNARGLSYNLRLGTNSGGVQVISPMSSTISGLRRVSQSGNAGQTNAWRLFNLPNGTYYWSVQAIDPGYAASPFATEGTFTLSRPVISIITNRTVPPNTIVGPIPFTVMDPETAASNLIVTVTSSDTNLVPASGLLLSGTGTNRMVRITPASNRSGTVTITIQALDEQNDTASRSFDIVYERFVDAAASLSSAAGPVAWGDVNNDGWLDLVKGSTLYRNLGNGSFTPVGGSLLHEGLGGFNDYNRDGFLDLLTVNANATTLYQGDGSGTFSSLNVGFAPAGQPRQWGAWGDYDNDGDPDVALATVSFTRIYRNNGTNFTDISAGLPVASNGSAAWGDYDKDGDLDLLIAGNGLTRIYRNNGNVGFSDAQAGLPALYFASGAWGDFDNDGWLDIALAGSTNNQSGGLATRIFRNTTIPTTGNRVFTNHIPAAAQNPQGVWKGAVIWGDYDNDGDPDLLVTGEILSGNTVPFTKLYRNDNGSFVDSGHPLPALRNSFAAWGDYNNDGSLDLALSGSDAQNVAVSRIYRNFPGAATNAPPVPPTSLTNVVVGKSIRLSWSAGIDTNQPSGLSYNLRVGTTPGAGNIVSPLSLANGRRTVAALGNINQRQSWTLTNLPGGTYYWSVQSVDSAFSGSPFSAEGMVTVSNQSPAAMVQTLSTDEDTAKSVLLSGTDPDGDPLTFGISAQPQFGQLTGTPPNLTYWPLTNFFGQDQFTFFVNDRTTNSLPAVVSIQVAPVQDIPAPSLRLELGQYGMAQIQLLAEPWLHYRIEASEDLIQWEVLTNLLNTNLFLQLLDWDSTNHPQRFYRAAESTPE